MSIRCTGRLAAPLNVVRMCVRRRHWTARPTGISCGHHAPCLTAVVVSQCPASRAPGYSEGIRPASLLRPKRRTKPGAARNETKQSPPGIPQGDFLPSVVVPVGAWPVVRGKLRCSFNITAPYATLPQSLRVAPLDGSSATLCCAPFGFA